MAYLRGDVVLVPFPFTDLSATRVRPAVVLSTPEFEEETGDVILTMVTSREHAGSTDYALRDWRRAGLVQASWVRIKLATLDRNLIQFSPGSLTGRDVGAVDSRLRRALQVGSV